MIVQSFIAITSQRLEKKMYPVAEAYGCSGQEG
jgi:hypothetical protein